MAVARPFPSIAQSEEHRHHSSNVRLKANILFEELRQGWSICRNGAIARRPKMFFDRVLHQVGLEGGFSNRLDPKPCRVRTGVAHELHLQPPGRGCALIRIRRTVMREPLVGSPPCFFVPGICKPVGRSHRRSMLPLSSNHR